MVSAGLICLSSAVFTAEFRPQLGGRLIRLTGPEGSDIIIPLLEDSFDPIFWPKSGAYPLIPYHNRMEHARITIAGKTLPLLPHPDAMPHSLHGPAQLKSWDAEQVSASVLVMVLKSVADGDWPWPFEARQVYQLDDDAMSVHLSVTNSGNTAMPAGLGWHPYFRSTAKAGHDAAFRWPHRTDYIPEGVRVPVFDDASLSAAQTAYLQDWSRIVLPLSSTSCIEMTADPLFDHLVLHRNDHYTCIEAVTHVANAVNLSANGVDFTGTRMLMPDETLQGTIRLRLV